MKRIFEEQRVKNLYEFERLLFPVRMKLELCFKKDELKLARITMDRRYRGYCAGPGGPAVKTLPSNAGGVGSAPDQGAKILHAS